MKKKKERAPAKSSGWGGLSGLHNHEKPNNILEALIHTTTDSISLETRRLIQTIWVSDCLSRMWKKQQLCFWLFFFSLSLSALLMQHRGDRRRMYLAEKECLTRQTGRIGHPFSILSPAKCKQLTHTGIKCTKVHTARGEADCVGNLPEHVTQRNQVSLS